MILFVSDTCPRCIPLKNMIKDETQIRIVNVTDNQEIIDKYGLSSVPVLRKDDVNILDIQQIVKIIKEGEK